MKRFLLVVASLGLLCTSCTTLSNRRDLYFPQRVDGPYTRMLSDGIPDPAPVENPDAPSAR